MTRRQRSARTSIASIASSSHETSAGNASEAEQDADLISGLPVSHDFTKLIPILNEFAKPLEYVQIGYQYAIEVGSDLAEAKLNDEVEEMEGVLKDIIEIDAAFKMEKDVIEKIRSRLQTSENIGNIYDAYEMETDHARKRYEAIPGDQKYAASEEYVTFQEKIWEIRNPDAPMPSFNQQDDDIMIGGEKISLRCPITQTLYSQPVSSTSCKHSYSKDAILQMLRTHNGSVVCPIPGCDKIVVEAELRPNKSLARMVARRQHDSDEEDEDEYMSLR